MKRCGFIGVVLVVMFSVLGSGDAWAEGLKMCVPEAANQAFKTPNTKGERTNTAKLKYKLVEIGKEGKEGPKGATGAPGERGPQGPEGKEGVAGKEGPEGKPGVSGLSGSELEALKGILPYVKFISAGVGGKPTVQFSGVNVQVVSGSGSTKGTVNGEGNIVIGYDENASRRPQTGSNNLILGEEQEFTSFGGIVAGSQNAITGPSASVTGGEVNIASGPAASVSGGIGNQASAEGASASGGLGNHASGTDAWVGGGLFNEARGEASAVFGGYEVHATDELEALP
jgi:hypothetical protein